MTDSQEARTLIADIQSKLYVTPDEDTLADLASEVLDDRDELEATVSALGNRVAVLEEEQLRLRAVAHAAEMLRPITQTCIAAPREALVALHVALKALKAFDDTRPL